MAKMVKMVKMAEIDKKFELEIELLMKIKPDSA